ncbi:S41 family peptidase [Brevundimonas sp.]|uniref:S41 family peptidase n=1 Tax=Brevundimonas sp. TaxID=1871086 RepID=UPI003D0F8F7D
MARTALAPAPGFSGGGLWLRVDREGGARGFFDNMSDRPIRSGDWAVYEIMAPVAADATRITAGFLLNGVGSGWIDAASLEVAAEAPAADRSVERPAGDRLANLEAFARVYGAVRWFSGASDPEEPRWATIAVEGARDVEQALDPGDLAARLRRWFEPMAPGIAIGAAPVSVASSESGSLVRWRHTGVAFGSAAYTGERIAAEAPEVWRADLPRGLALALPVTASGGPVAEAASGAASTSAQDRAVRLGGVVIAWNVFRHFYPYFTDEGRAWDAALPEWLAEAATASDERAFKVVLERMVARLNDGHGEVWPSSQVYTLPLVWQPIEGALVITGLPSDAPEGLAVGDVVVAINERPTAELLAAESERVSASTDHHRIARATRRLALQEEHRPVILSVRRADGGLGEVRVDPMPTTTMTGVLAEPRPDAVTWLPAGVWYLDLTRLTTPRLNEALARVEPGQAVIFDMRGYPGDIQPAFLGRLSAEAVTTPPFRIPVDLLPEGRSRTWKPVGWSVPATSPRITGPVAFLTDARAISYAETLMAMVAGHHLGEIVGGPTAGTNGNINPFSLPGGYRISWTGMEVVNHDGSPLTGHGVQPTIAVSRTIAGVAAGRDEVLERAVDEVAPASNRPARPVS